MARLTLLQVTELLRPAWVVRVEESFWDLSQTNKGLHLDLAIKYQLHQAGAPFAVPPEAAAPHDLSADGGAFTIDIKYASRLHVYLSHNELLFGNSQVAAGRDHAYAVYRRLSPTALALDALVPHDRLLALDTDPGDPLRRGAFSRLVGMNDVHCAATGRVEAGWSFSWSEAQRVADAAASDLVLGG